MSSLSESDNRRIVALERMVEQLMARNPPPSAPTSLRPGRNTMHVRKTAHGFTRGKAVALHNDGAWVLLGSSDTDVKLWGIVERTTANTFQLVTNGEAVVPSAALTVGAKYKFTAGVASIATDLVGVIATATTATHLFVGASGGGGGSGEVTVDVYQAGHGFTVGKYLCRDYTTGLLVLTDNTDPTRCDVRGFVSTVIDVDNFTLTLEGWNNVVAGSTATLYLSTAGNLANTTPTSGQVIPILYPVERDGTFDGYFTSIHPPLQRNEMVVTQTAHGFAAGNLLYGGGTSWAKAKADAITTARVSGIVTRVISVDKFVVASSGVIGVDGASFNNGSLYYLSGSTAGLANLPDIPPLPGYAVPVYVAVSSTRIALCFGEPTFRMQVGDATQPGVFKVFNAVGPAIELDPTLVTVAGRKLYVREWTLCEGATTKKCLILSSDLYT